MNKDELDKLYPLPDTHFWCISEMSYIPYSIRLKPDNPGDHSWYCVWFYSATKEIMFDVPGGRGQTCFCHTTLEEAPAIIWAKFMFDFNT